MLALFACGAPAATTNQVDKPLSSTLMRLVGSARHSMDNGATWEKAKIGDILKPGVLVQTAENARLYVLLGEIVRPLPPSNSGNGGLFDPYLFPANLISIDSNSSLQIQKLIEKNPKDLEHPLQEVRLGLRSGKMLGCIKDSPSDTDCEVEFPGGTVCVHGATFSLTSIGIISVMSGAVAIISTNQNLTNTVTAGGRFDQSLGVKTNLPPLPTNWQHDIWLPSDPYNEPWLHRKYGEPH
jgi:hypothetical protein